MFNRKIFLCEKIVKKADIQGGVSNNNDNNVEQSHKYHPEIYKK